MPGLDDDVLEFFLRLKSLPVIAWFEGPCELRQKCTFSVNFGTSNRYWDSVRHAIFRGFLCRSCFLLASQAHARRSLHLLLVNELLPLIKAGNSLPWGEELYTACAEEPCSFVCLSFQMTRLCIRRAISISCLLCLICCLRAANLRSWSA